MTKWIRHAREPGEVIPLKMSFKSGDPRYVSLERLINSLPWGQGNRVLLQALEMGSQQMLSLMQAQAQATQAQAQATQAHSPLPPVRAKDAATPVAGQALIPTAPPSGQVLQTSAIPATSPAESASSVSSSIPQGKSATTAAGQAAYKAFRRG